MFYGLYSVMSGRRLNRLNMNGKRVQYSCLHPSLEGISHQSAYPLQLRLEPVVLQAGVGHHAADAVLAESAGLDAKLSQQCEDGRIDIAVAFQLDDDEVAGLCVLVGLEVVELDVEVDGQSLRLGVVDQCDAVEVILDGLVYVGGVATNQSVQELVILLNLSLSGHLNALLLRATVVVLGLHFEEGDIAVHVCANAHLLSWGTSVVVLHVEVVVVGVPVSRFVRGYLAAAVELSIVVSLRQLEQFCQILLVGNELGVGAVHQPDGRHLLQCDGLQLLQKFVYAGIDIHLCLRY